MRRILLLITDLEIGGTPTVVRELATRLAATGECVVEVACLSKWGPVADQLRNAGVHVAALNCSGVIELIPAVTNLTKLIRSREYDTVFSFLMHANVVAAVASRFLRSRKVRFLQSIQTTQRYPRWHWKLQSIAQHAADTVVVPTESVGRSAVDWAHVDPAKVVVIPNAIAPDSFERSMVPLESPTPYPVGFIGRLDAVKRVPELVQQLHALRQTFPRTPVHLHIFGEGEQRWRIEHEIERLHLKNQVTLHGRVDSPQAALQQIGVLVLPSVAEGFGLVLIEAMAAGVPVVAANSPGIRDVVRHEETGLLVELGTDFSMAFAIMRVIEDESLRTTLIANGLREARERYSWEPVIAKYRNVLQMAGGHRE